MRPVGAKETTTMTSFATCKYSLQCFFLNSLPSLCSRPQACHPSSNLNPQSPFLNLGSSVGMLRFINRSQSVPATYTTHNLMLHCMQPSSIEVSLVATVPEAHTARLALALRTNATSQIPHPGLLFYLPLPFHSC